MLKQVCDFESCNRQQSAKGLCKPHYEQQRMGKPLVPIRGDVRLTCTFKGCSNVLRSNNLCNGHDKQKRRGELKPLQYRKKKHSSFEQVLRERTIVDLESGCCLWQGTTNKGGYGQIRMDKKIYQVHRLAYELPEGPIPEGLFLDHINCISKACWRPDHLRPVTNKENMENIEVLDPRNISGHRGVSYDRGRNKWRAYVNHHGKQINLGRFDTPEEANQAVIAKRNELYTHNDLDRVA